MKVILSPFAESEFERIVRYYAENISPQTAEKIFNGITKAIIKLSTYPNLGAIEQSLSSYNKNHRYIVSGNYKIIFRKTENEILITDIFDARQDPQKLTERNK